MHEASEVDQMVDVLIEREGGYVNHPADKGGPTCFGITEAQWRAPMVTQAQCVIFPDRKPLPSTSACIGYVQASSGSPAGAHVWRRSSLTRA